MASAAANESSASAAAAANGQTAGENGGSGGGGSTQDSTFECNICLDTSKDAVISLCGHLFWWDPAGPAHEIVNKYESFKTLFSLFSLDRSCDVSS